ncbi:MAG: N-acetyl-gamma-glutamyl-phosphate reductase [Planctomycetaceae bacterium]
MTATRVDLAILGATGYGGQELLRLLASHPGFRVAAACSERLAGRRVEEAMPQLAGCYPELLFRAPDELPRTCRAVVLATPHGVSHTLWRQVTAALPEARVVDLSGDFRLKDRAAHEAAYGKEIPFLEDRSLFAYGLPETNRAAVARSRFVSNPGCFATGALLALAPLAEAGLLSGDVTLAQTTGSSGSGAEPKEGTHHPERAQDQRAYKVLAHQHEPEVAQELKRLGGAGFDLGMVPQSGAFSRGIFTVAHVRLDRDVDAAALYGTRYAREPFVRLRTESPALRHVVRTNFCDLSVTQRGRRVVVLTAIDNLTKGMSGQALQNLNLLFGMEETAGLLVPGANP